MNIEGLRPIKSELLQRLQVMFQRQFCLFSYILNRPLSHGHKMWREEKIIFHQHNQGDNSDDYLGLDSNLSRQNLKLMSLKRRILSAWLCCTFTIHTDRMCIIAAAHYACLHAWWKENVLHTTKTEKRLSSEWLLPHECVTAIWKRALKYSIWWF